MNTDQLLNEQSRSLRLIETSMCCLNAAIKNIGLGSGDESIQSLVTADSITPNVDLYTAIKITALTSALTINNHTGTASEMYAFIIRIKDDGDGPYDITWDTEYRAIGVTLPITIDHNKTMYIGMIWNAYDSTFDVTSVMIEV